MICLDIFVPFFLLLFLSDLLLIPFLELCVYGVSLCFCICMLHVLFLWCFCCFIQFCWVLFLVFIVPKRDQQSPNPVHLLFGTILRAAFLGALALVTSGVEQNKDET